MNRAARALAAVLVAGCAARATPIAPGPAVRSLAAHLDSSFADPLFARSMWGVVVRSVDRGDVLYRLNSERLFKPASNVKLVTGAAALVRLGPDYRFTTIVLGRGVRSGDTLAGDLVVVGRGDPSLSLRVTGGSDVLASVRPWADSLRARGIRVVTGRVVGDATWFPDPVLGRGWMWDDLPFDYSAPVAAVQFNEGSVLLELVPGARAGDSGRVTMQPSGAPLRVFAEVETAPADSAVRRVDWTRAPFSDSVSVRARISARMAPTRLVVSVSEPVRYFEAALTQALREAGIMVLGGATTPASPADTLFAWRSIPLGELLPHFEKPSQNQIGEALLRTLGGEATGIASVDSGRAVVREVMRGFGVPDDAYSIADGSGVSHYNYLAPEAVARLLYEMARGPHAELFIRSLPLAGSEGTLATRMRGTAAAGNARAKTGSITGARTLSGYVTTADGERLLFVLMANHFVFPGRLAEAVQDSVVERLANFRRGAPAR